MCVPSMACAKGLLNKPVVLFLLWAGWPFCSCRRACNASLADTKKILSFASFCVHTFNSLTKKSTPRSICCTRTCKNIFQHLGNKIKITQSNEIATMQHIYLNTNKMKHSCFDMSKTTGSNVLQQNGS